MTNEQILMIFEFCKEKEINSDDILSYVIDLNPESDDPFMNAD